MISFVRGTVAHVAADRITVDMGAVGLSVHCTAGTARSVRHGEHVELMTTLVVREDGWTLFGFLGFEERALFEQVQTYEESVTIGPEPVAHTTALPFNHPVKFLAWAFTDGATHARFTGGVPHEPCEAMGPLLDARLSLEGNDRTSYRSGAYFGQLQSYEHFGGTRLPAGMYVYSFAELPRDWRPTGTCNMSRLNSVVLQYRTKGAAAQDLASVQDERYTTASAADLKRLLVFAMNYNVLVIRGGRCVVLFGGA